MAPKKAPPKKDLPADQASEPVLQDPQYGKQIAALQEQIDAIKAALGSALGVVVD